MKRKIIVTTGSRSEYGILRPVLESIRISKKLELFLIVTGMHLSKKHGMTIHEIEKDGFKIASKINMFPSDDTNYAMAIALGKGIMGFSKIFKEIKPDINLVLGDRDEILASAIAAYHMNILNAHIHGGDKTKAGIDEYNRHVITKMSNIHFAATKKSKERIIKMGENPKYVHLTGSPSIDGILKSKITEKKDLEKKFGVKFKGTEIILLQHPVTTQTNYSEIQILNTLRAVAKVGHPTIAIAPNSDAGNKKIFEHLESFEKRYDFIKLYRNLPRSDFLGLLKNCGVLVGNSSSGIIEGSYFDISVVNIGIRQKNRESGKNVLNVRKESMESIYAAILMALKRKKSHQFINRYIYGHGNASAKIVRYLENIKLDKELIQKQISY